MNQDIASHPLFQQLMALDLPVEDFAIFGSTPLYLLGLRSEIKDIDLIARGSAWEKAKKIGELKTAPQGSGEMVVIGDGSIEIFKQWVPDYWDVDELIDTADIYEGVRFVSLENVLKWKKLMGREKDLVDVSKIENYLQKMKK